MFSSPLFFFQHAFPLLHLLMLALGRGIAPDGGGTDSAAPAASPSVLTGSPPAPGFLASGFAARDLVRDVMPFTAVETFKVSELASGAGALPIYTCPTVSPIYRGRASAELVGPLTVHLAAKFKTNATVFALNGFAALRGYPAQSTYKTTIAGVAAYPGSVSLTLTQAISTSGILELPPGIHTNMIIVPVIGKPPALIFAFNMIGIEEVTIAVSGLVHLSGVGEISF